jgi:hypothetical protein
MDDVTNYNLSPNSTKYILNHNYQQNNKQFREIEFVNNAIKNGWCVIYKNNKYTFSKKHHNNCKIFDDDYVYKFILENVYDVSN